MDHDEDFKSLLIWNDSSDAIQTLYVYPHWCCWMSKESKMIYHGEKYLYRSKKRFQFEVVARFDDRKDKKGEDDSQSEKKDEEDKQDKPKKKKQVLRKVQQWKEDKLLKITGFFGSESLDVVEGDLTHYPEDKQICLRKLQRDKELKVTSGGRNLYEILGLDMAKVRKMSKEEQKQAIRKGYYTQIRRWHPDNNCGDEEIAKEIILAYKILEDEALRARYNNLADYDGGWLSWSRYKAIFKPECVKEEQKKAYRKRMCMFALSLLITAAGIGLTVGTAGLAAPALVAVGAIFAGGFIGGGFQSLQHTLNQRAIVDECLAKEWLMKAVIGFLGGAATGGAAAGFTAAITGGLGSAALESAAITAGQYVGVGAATGATGCVASSIASDVGRKFVDGEEITLKQVVGHAICGGLIGAVAGVAGGSVSKALVGSQASAASANLRGDAVEQVLIVTARRRFATFLAQSIPRMLTESGTEAVMGTMFRFAEERLDDSVENRRPSKHVEDGIKDVTVKGLKWVARFAAAAVFHDWNEMKEHPRLNKELQNTAYTEAMNMTSQERRGKIRYEMYMENNEHRHNWRDGKCSAKYQPPFRENTSAFAKEIEKNSDLPEKNEEDRDSHRTGKWLPVYQPPKNEESSSQSLPYDLIDFGEESARKSIIEGTNAKVQYISEGAWHSKMVVSYFLNDHEVVEEARGSGSSVDILSVAWNIKVKFQVRLPFWGDICKYDRFDGFWCKPYQPPFRENTSAFAKEIKKNSDLPEKNEEDRDSQRTGKWLSVYQPPKNEETSSQSLPSNLIDFGEESARKIIIEGTNAKVQYISEGAWHSKMVVSYFLNDHEVVEEARGSGSSVDILSVAWNIKVKFQVRLPFWGDICKYDRFDGFWCKPYQPPFRENTSAFAKEIKKNSDLPEKNEEDRDSQRTGKWLSVYQPPKNEETSSQSLPSNLIDFGEESARKIIIEGTNAKVQYISEGAWFSKMVVSYFLNGHEVVEEARGSGSSVDIPSVAWNIKVKFQERRPFWGDICKYERFGGFWCKPYQPHVFCYDSPPIHRTYTISGGLWYEALTRVTDEYHAETNGKVKYISEGAWFSKMVVSYFLNGHEVVEEACGSGSSVDIPSVARNIKVKFQVRRPFWGDICKYDRFSGFWCKPYQPHVFCYDSPPIHRTFIISGGLWYEAVMRVTDEYHEETKEM